MLKMSQRVEKYMICACVDSRQEKAAIFEAISHYQGVILCDVPGQLRNDLLKYCFSRQMRTYVVPKISDIIVRGGEEIRLFDTPLLLCRNSGLRIEQRIVNGCLTSLCADSGSTCSSDQYRGMDCHQIG